MRLILKNNSSEDFSYLEGEIIIPSGGFLDVPPSHWFALYTDLIFLEDLKMNTLITSDGIRDMTAPESVKFLKELNEFNFNNKDIDGALIVRTKAAKKGWSFWAVPIEFRTSTIDASLFCQYVNGSNVPGITGKIYDGDDNEITTPGLLNANLNNCVKTVIDFEPQFDFEIIGGQLRINANPAQDIRLWIVGAPDIPVEYGGSKEFASGINLKFMAPNASFEVDGRVTKFLTYDPQTHQGKIRILLKHPAGASVNMQIVIQLYRL